MLVRIGLGVVCTLPAGRLADLGNGVSFEPEFVRDSNASGGPFSLLDLHSRLMGAAECTRAPVRAQVFEPVSFPDQSVHNNSQSNKSRSSSLDVAPSPRVMALCPAPRRRLAPVLSQTAPRAAQPSSRRVQHSNLAQQPCRARRIWLNA